MIVFGATRDMTAVDPSPAAQVGQHPVALDHLLDGLVARIGQDACARREAGEPADEQLVVGDLDAARLGVVHDLVDVLADVSPVSNRAV